MKILFSLLLLFPGLCYGQGNWIGLSGYSSYQTNAIASNLGTGNIDLFTVPTGKKVIVNSVIAGTTNQSGTSLIMLVKTNSNYYLISGLNAITTNFNINLGANILYSFVFVENETVAVNTSSTGVNVWLGLNIIPASCPIVCAKSLALASGDNTLYVCPTNRIACNPMLSSVVPAVPFSLILLNHSGATRTIKNYFVSAGDIPGNASIIGWRSLVTNSQISLGLTTFTNGMSVVSNTDSGATGQVAWITVFEQPVVP